MQSTPRHSFDVQSHVQSVDVRWFSDTSIRASLGKTPKCQSVRLVQSEQDAMWLLLIHPPKSSILQPSE